MWLFMDQYGPVSDDFACLQQAVSVKCENIRAKLPTVPISHFHNVFKLMDDSSAKA